LNRDNKLAPVGGVGELYIAGDGVARGYLNNPELTAEKFIENPLVPGERVYRTGDLARWTGDGNIEYLGRADRQVKIRGYRVEPGEIETRLLNHDNVKEAVVTAKEGKSGDTYLCAYLVPTETAVPDVPRLRDYLSRTLPDHMIPSYFVTLEKIPLTANGKIDGKALPEPEIAVSGRRIAPTGKVEEKLAEIWSGILDIDYDLIGIDNNFFELGGHSLKATVLTAKIHKEFDVRVPLEEVFHTPTIRELAQYVADRSTSGTGEETFTAIEAAENRSFYPLTSAQKGLYVQQQKEKESTTYNILQVEALDIDADLAGIERTIRELIERHESLRTSFFEYRLKPVQKIHDHVDFNAEYYDLNKEKNRIPDDIVKDFVRPFDLSLPPLMRAGFIKTQEGKHLLIMDMHHIITDGVSFGIFYRDFLRLYRGEQLPPLRLQYRDYSAWQNRRGEQAAYWLNVFKGKIPVLSMPTDYKRPEVKSFEGDHFYFEIKEPLKGALNRSAKEHEATLFMLLLAAYYVLLSKYSNQEDIVVGSPVTGRRHEDLQEIIGMFVNMLALRNKPRAEKTFTEFLREVKQGVLAAMENQDYHFEELVPALGIKGNISRNPLFDAAFALQNMDVGEIEAFDGIVDRQNSAVTPGKYEPGVSRFDLVITAVEGTDSIKMSLEYSTALFKPTTAENLVNHYLEILEQVAENPGSKLEDIKVSYQLAPIENTDLRDHEADFGF
ncbi:MAG: AMP-binding protein, partial [bacterium]|nr:AMP-binding protein [bacterium]